MTVKQRVIKVFEEEGVDFLNREARVGIDSLTFITLIVAIEKEFGVEIPDENINLSILNDDQVFVSVVQQLVDHNFDGQSHIQYKEGGEVDGF